MPVTKRLTGSASFDFFVQIAGMSQSLASLIPVPAVGLAAATAIAIINIVAEVKANRSECARLAWRASRMLLELSKRMHDKWDTAPAALVDNIREFEQTLLLIRDFMNKATEETWLKRLVAKNNFDSAIIDFNARLDAAAQSFQIASLIEIHYAIGVLQQQSTLYGPALLTAEPLSITAMPEPELAEPGSADIMTSCTEDLRMIQSESDSTDKTVLIRDQNIEVLPIFKEAVDTTELDEFLAQLDGEKDKFGFRRYHQADVRMGRNHRRAVGWFSGTGDAQVDGRKVTVKRYGSEKQDAQKWVKDIKILRKLFHANIPQIVGYSDGKTSVPFILLANGPTKDVGLYVEKTLKSQSLAKSACTLLNIYRDVQSASMHVKQQLALTDEQLQDFIEDATYTVDDGNNVLMGLTPPKEGWITARSYNLCESLVDRAIKYLKELEYAEESATAGSIARRSVAGKTRQLRSLLESLLPRRTDEPALCSSLEDLLDEDPDDIRLTELRHIALELGRHGHSWRERCPPRTLVLGDYGVMLDGGKDFANFKVLGNIFNIDGEERCTLEIANEVEGSQVRWVNRFTERQQASPYILPGGLEGWPVALMPQETVTVFAHRRHRLVSVNDTWKYFIEYAPALGKRHGVDTHSLILVIATENINDFKVNDWSPAPLRAPFGNSMGFRPQTSNFHTPFNALQNTPFNTAPIVPTIVYLFTSGEKDFEPYITDDPMGRPRPRATRSTNWCYSCQSGWPVEYANYIQLEEEDCC